MTKLLCVVGACAAIASSAHAQYKVIGAFNGWDNGTSVAMTNMGGGLWQASVSGFSANAVNEFKVNVGDWSVSWPTTGNTKAIPTSSTMTVNFWDNASPGDGWSPNSQRVGYVDQGGTGFEIIGDFNGWSAPILTLTDMGGGLYSGVAAVAPGAHLFKFRSTVAGWGMSYGAELGDPNPEASVTAGANPIKFELDTYGGRWRATEVPAPGALGLLGVAGLIGVRRRR